VNGSPMRVVIRTGAQFFVELVFSGCMTWATAHCRCPAKPNRRRPARTHRGDEENKPQLIGPHGLHHDPTNDQMLSEARFLREFQHSDEFNFISRIRQFARRAGELRRTRSGFLLDSTISKVSTLCPKTKSVFWKASYTSYNRISDKRRSVVRES